MSLRTTPQGNNQQGGQQGSALLAQLLQYILQGNSRMPQQNFQNFTPPPPPGSYLNPNVPLQGIDDTRAPLQGIDQQQQPITGLSTTPQNSTNNFFRFLGPRA